MKVARMKRNAKRKRRREWIQNQIKEGKLHKSALIWVNSNKILPYEKEEKERKSEEVPEESNIEEDELDDHVLQSAIDSIREPKDLKGHVKKSFIET